MERQYGEQELLRRDSLQKLRDLGINPYPAEEYVVDADSQDIRDHFSDDEELPRQVRIAG